MEKSAIIEIQQAANASIKTETGTPSKNESQDERLASAIRKMFKELGPSVSNKCRIYKVPYQLRTLNPEAYTPHVISIGPYHHNNDNCRSMEKHKVRYFENFMDLVKRTGLEMENLIDDPMKVEAWLLEVVRRVMVKEASSKCARDEVALSILEEKPSSKCVVPDELASTKCLLDEVASSEQDEDTSKSILDISFKNGVLEIPSLLFDDNTEAFVRNIMALEQCDYISEAYVTDFYVILDDLIDTDEDVELLINEGNLS
uniref:Uncharacterized protein n=1 Tax=Fagus sylvatica TaxID=28930 RepID=A0A2N9HQG3_FAGSY